MVHIKFTTNIKSAQLTKKLSFLDSRDIDNEQLCPPPPPRISKMSMAFGSSTKVMVNFVFNYFI